MMGKMARDLKEYRIFFASPGGLQKERLAFRDIITEYNQLESSQRGIHFVAVGWRIRSLASDCPCRKRRSV
jgi:hypothetical protein